MPKAVDQAPPSLAAFIPHHANAILHWQPLHGRHDLPWQNTQDPYRVWLSEIMLQQTQVATVKGYFTRFLETFPNVQSLAEAHLDAVLGLWSGLGYYSRARNLHRCAQQIMQLHGGAFPRSAEVLATLPGIGRSTAAAIAALCFAQRVAILDANVKRVLTRVLGFAHDLSVAQHSAALWDAASALLPSDDLPHTMPIYTQGMMDLGASLCSTKNPQCQHCPLAALCTAHQAGEAERYPLRSRKIKRSHQSVWLLWASTKNGSVLLAQRPTPGVWAGLYCLPWFESEEALLAALPARLRSRIEAAPAFTHVLTHKDLQLYPMRLSVAKASALGDMGIWVAASDWAQMGLPAPVRKLLTSQL